MYGLKVVSFEKRRYDLKRGLLYFLCAITFHGLFDIVLINKMLHDFVLVAYVMMVAGVYGLNSMYNYALNISPSFNGFRRVNPLELRKYLLASFTAILLFEFLLGAVTNGFYASYDLLIDSLLGFLILLLYLVFGLSEFTLVYGYRTGIVKYIQKFNYPDLLYTEVTVAPSGKKNLSFTPFALTTSYRILVDNATNYILATTQGNLPHNGFSDFVLMPFKYLEQHKKGIYQCRLYGMEEGEGSALKVLGNVEVSVAGKETVKPRTFWERMNAGSLFVMIVLFIVLFVYYMEYRSSRVGYRWSFDFLEKKVLSKAGQNLDYAVYKDPSYTEAHLLLGKMALVVNDWQNVFKHSVLAEPHDRKQRICKEYLTGKYFYKVNKYEEAKKYFSGLTEVPEVRDSASYYLLQIYVKENNPKEIARILENVFPETFNDSINFIKANYFIAGKEFKKASGLLSRDLVKKGSNLPYYHYWSGSIALAQGDTAEACQSFRASAKMGYDPAQVSWGINCYGREAEPASEMEVIQED